MAESLAIPPTLLFKLTETRGNEDRLKLIVRSLKAKFAETNDSKCVFTHPGARPVVRYPNPDRLQRVDCSLIIRHKNSIWQ